VLKNQNLDYFKFFT